MNLKKLETILEKNKILIQQNKPTIFGVFLTKKNYKAIVNKLNNNIKRIPNNPGYDFFKFIEGGINNFLVLNSKYKKTVYKEYVNDDYFRELIQNKCRVIK